MKSKAINSFYVRMIQSLDRFKINHEAGTAEVRTKIWGRKTIHALRVCMKNVTRISTVDLNFGLCLIPALEHGC